MYQVVFGKKSAAAQAAIALTIFSLLPSLAFSGSSIPADKSGLASWFSSNVGAASARKGALDPPLVAAEVESPKVIKVRAAGGGDFKTITDAIKSIPSGNEKRVVVDIGPGTYKEQVKIERTKTFVSLVGSGSMPTLTFGLTSLQTGVLDSATLIVESDYFSASNLNIVNSAPAPDGKRKGSQAVAMRISGDKAAFYNCKFIGFQDTLCDDRGKHFFKDCYIEGTVDFIFGSGKSLYLNTEIRILKQVNDGVVGVITAQAGQTKSEDTGYSFVHCTITGAGGKAQLGRAWMPAPKVVFAYSAMGDAVSPDGWSDDGKSDRDSTVSFGEYKNSGPGSSPSSRVPYAKQLTDAEAATYLSLGYIDGSKWLLPPPKA